MGIRVHKSIGYGLRPFKAPEGFREKVNEACEMTLGDFAKWCKPRMDRILEFAPDDRGRRMMFQRVDLLPLNKKHFKQGLSERIIYDDEFGFKDAIVLQPIAHDSWSRYDATIDWVEEGQFHGAKKRFRFVKCGLYPHDLGKPPLSVAALMLWLGIEDQWPKLHEALYVHWA